MALLDEFKKVELNNNAPSVSISQYGLTFNKTSVELLGSPKYVNLYLDAPKKRLAIVASESAAIPFCLNNDGKCNPRINNKEFSRQLFALMGWEDKTVSYRVIGEWHDDEKIFIFNLLDAIRIVNPSMPKKNP